MTTISATLSAVGASQAIHLHPPGDTFTYTADLSADFDGILTLDYSSDGLYSWKPVLTISEDALTATTYYNGSPGWYRFRVALGSGKETLTGNAAITLVDATMTVTSWENADGDEVFAITEEGIRAQDVTVAGTLTITGDMTYTGDVDFTGAVDMAMGTNIAAAATVNLDTATGNYVTITGNTGITAITLSAGHWRLVKFTGTPEITHGASLVLPGAANITAAIGDTALFVGEGSSVTKCLFWQLGSETAAGRALLDDANATAQRTTLGFSTGAHLVETHGSDVASAGTINLTTATGTVVDVTGTTGITAITLAEGYTRIVRFTGILTMTNGASLVLPGGADITTAAGDYAIFAGYAAGVVRCVGYFSAKGLVTLSGTETLTNKTLTAPTIDGGTINRTAQTRIYTTYAKVGATAGWVVGGGAVDGGLCATLPAYLTGSGVNEVVTITADSPPTQGTWKLTFGGQETASMTFDESAANIQTKFTALSTVGSGNATVSGTLATAVVITFTGTLAATNVGAVTVTSATTLASDAGTNERQDLTPGAAPLEGSFKLNYGGQTSAAIAFDASAATIQSSMEAMTSIGAGNVVVSGTISPGGEAQCTFQGALAATDMAAMTVSDNTMHSDAGTAEVQTLTCDAPATSGTTKLTFGGNSTANLNWNATAGTLQSALQGLAGASNATVAGTFDAGLVTITFGADDGNVGQVTVTDDVLKSDAGTNEVQRLTCGVNAVSGAIQVTFDGQTSASIAYNDNAATIQGKLEAMANIGAGNVGVTGSFDASPVELTFQGTLAATNVAEVATTANTLKSDAGTNERQDITPSNTPDAGSYMLKYGSTWTTELAFDANAATIQAALEVIPALTGNVTVAGDATTEIQVTFGGSLAATDVAAMTAAEVELEDGGVPTQLVVSEHTKGVVPTAVVVTPSTVTPGVAKTAVVVTPATTTPGVAKTDVTLTVSEHTKGVVPALVTATPVAAPAGSHTDNTNSTLIVPISGLKTSDTITGFGLLGQVESAGNTVVLDADLRSITAGTADVTDASVGTITQVSVTADTKLDATNAGKTGLTEACSNQKTYYVLLQGTTDLLTDIALQGVYVTVTEA